MGDFYRRGYQEPQQNAASRSGLYSLGCLCPKEGEYHWQVISGFTKTYFISSTHRAYTLANMQHLILSHSLSSSLIRSHSLSFALILSHSLFLFICFFLSHSRKRPGHHILSGPHPSPLSAHRGFFGCKHFSKTNDLLIKEGVTPIDWTKLPLP